MKSQIPPLKTNRSKLNSMNKCNNLFFLNFLNIDRYYFLILIFLVPLWCSADVIKNEHTARVIHFSEFEQGSGQYPITMTITTDFLRIDDTKEGKDFVLFNRKEKAIYSVNSEEQQIIKIKLMPVSIPSPIELKIREEKLDMDDKAPLIAGKKAQHHQFYVNDKLCYDMISVPGLMPDSVEALKEFKQVLAGQQSETLRYIPGDLQEGCDLVRHTFYPQLYLDKGFPILEKAILSGNESSGETNGLQYSRALVNFLEQEVSLEHFSLPEYQIITIN